MPNFVFILTDDQRYDALGCANPLVVTPHMDALAERGVRFDRAFVTTSICSPSRACCLTGRYGRANGVTGLGMGLDADEVTFAQRLRRAGYRTGYVGKWHLKRPDPAGAGFDSCVWFRSNGPHHGRTVVEGGERKVAEGYIEDYLAARSVAFLEEAAARDRPFLLHIGTQVPHMDHRFRWPASERSLALYEPEAMPVSANWRDDLEGKPPYLETARSRTRALHYGYARKEAIQRHFRHYFAAVTDMDRALGTVLAALDRLGLRNDTWILLMGDNGWMMGEHTFTSKVLAYEASIRVPFLVAGPGLSAEVCQELVLNADVAPTILDLAGLPVPGNVHGRSLVPLLRGQPVDWRQSFLYEALEPELGARPVLAVRTGRWKYIQTLDPRERARVDFEELYDLETDPGELHNLAHHEAHQETLAAMRAELERLKGRIR
ncbi:MAG: sulfatase-like hydrolase/transferase [Candidatus Brocadiia bacterium]